MPDFVVKWVEQIAQREGQQKELIFRTGNGEIIEDNLQDLNQEWEDPVMAGVMAGNPSHPPLGFIDLMEDDKLPPPILTEAQLDNLRYHLNNPSQEGSETAIATPDGTRSGVANGQGGDEEEDDDQSCGQPNNGFSGESTSSSDGGTNSLGSNEPSGSSSSFSSLSESSISTEEESYNEEINTSDEYTPSDPLITRLVQELEDGLDETEGTDQAPRRSLEAKTIPTGMVLKPLRSR